LTFQRIHIIGIGDDGLDGLTTQARQLIEQAELLIGDDHTLQGIPAGRAQRLLLSDDLSPALDAIHRHPNQRVVILASGDPLFYGVARFFCDKLGKDRFEIVPHVSSMQLAFARVKESWDEAFLTNLANHPLELVVEQIRVAAKVGLFTTEALSPPVVAKALCGRGIDYFTAYVCENLGARDERVWHGELRELGDHHFAAPNVLILIRRPNAPDRPSERVGRRLFGNPDHAFLQSKPKQGLITPAEVRTLALAEMDLGPSSTVWDVGAGSGSVAIEAAQIASAGTTYAIEMDPDDHRLIRANAEAFGVHNLVPVLGRAPEAWADLPDPDSVFVGGLGREVGRLVEMAYARLRQGGRIVINVASIENVGEVHALLHRLAPDVQVSLINIARGTHQLERIRFDALNPTFLLAAVKRRGN
jgi:precorrin-6Y C5,15-methyltransferase (decarboxylating)